MKKHTQKYLLLTFLCLAVFGCTSKPVLRNVDSDAEEKQINTPEQVVRLKNRNE